jgi:hypothetical protein
MFTFGSRRTSMTMLPVLAAVLTLVLMPLSVYVNASSSNTNNSNTNTTSKTLTPNQLAAAGPLPGNFSLVEGEQDCINSLQNETAWAPWYPTMASTEKGGSERAAVFECAHFGGSFTEPNQVYAYQSPNSLGGPTSWLVTREPNELYAIIGPAGLALPGPSISKMEAGSLRENWRTPLSNNNVTGDFLVSGAGNFPADGTIAVTQGQYLYKVNASTGAVEKVVSLPTGENPPRDSNYDGMNAFADGNLVLKTQNRVAGCTNQGYNFLFCPNQSQAAPSVIAVVDPITFKVLDWEQLPEMIGGRNTVTQFQGKDYLYLFGTSSAFRYEWNGQNITLDTSWGPVPYLTEGQTLATAPVIMGDWVIGLTNGGAPTNASLSVVAISQADPNKIVRINPIPLEPGQMSFIPSTLSVDLPNNRIYAMDYLPGKVVAVDFTQDGNMSVAWGPVDQRTISFLTLIGPADQRVLVATNINPNATQQQLEQAAKGIDYTYTEQIVWRDADTGELLVQSDYFPAMSPGILITPGYGGLIYDLLYNGHIMALQVAPAFGSPPSPGANNNSTSTTSGAG